ncbi:MAG TPA: hypothetical protein VGF39_06675 [Stellaceae bacterium]
MPRGPQPTGQSETVAASLESDRYPFDGVAGLLGLLAPAMQQSQESRFARFELLCRVPLDSWNNAGNEPARLAHLDHRDQRAIFVESGERSALMFAFKGSDAIIRFRRSRRSELEGAHSRRQDPKTPVEQALMRGLVTA